MRPVPAASCSSLATRSWAQWGEEGGGAWGPGAVCAGVSSSRAGCSRGTASGRPRAAACTSAEPPSLLPAARSCRPSLPSKRAHPQDLGAVSVVLHPPPRMLHRPLALVQLAARQPGGGREARRDLGTHRVLPLSRHRGCHKHVLPAPAGAAHARWPRRVVRLPLRRLLAAAGGGGVAARLEPGCQQPLHAVAQRGAAQVVGKLSKLVLSQARLRWGARSESGARLRGRQRSEATVLQV